MVFRIFKKRHDEHDAVERKLDRQEHKAHEAEKRLLRLEQEIRLQELRRLHG